MAQNQSGDRADIRIEGPVAGHHYKAIPSLTQDGSAKVHTLEIMTSSTESREDAMFHKAVLIETDSTDKETRMLLSRLEVGYGGYGNATHVSLRGRLVNTREDGLIVKAESITEKRQKVNSARAEVSGVIEKILPYRSGYTATLSVENPYGMDKKMSVSFLLGKKENPDTVKKIAEGKISEGDTLLVTGNLLSQTMGDGNRKFNFCSVRAESVKVLKKAQKQTERTRVGKQTI